MQKEPWARKEVLDILENMDLNCCDSAAKQKFTVILK